MQQVCGGATVPQTNPNCKAMRILMLGSEDPSTNQKVTLVRPCTAKLSKAKTLVRYEVNAVVPLPSMPITTPNKNSQTYQSVNTQPKIPVQKAEPPETEQLIHVDPEHLLLTMYGTPKGVLGGIAKVGGIDAFANNTHTHTHTHTRMQAT